MVNHMRPAPLPVERRTLRSHQLHQKASARPLYSIPELCPGGTVVCCASGPSLLREDVEYAHSKGATIIAVNDAYLFAPFAVALMASDAAWWIHKKPEFAGLRFSLDANANRVEGVILLRRTGESGIERDPTGLRSGRNSGAAAINLAAHFLGRGAAGGRILLLGYDMSTPRGEKHSHFFGAHKFPLRGGSPYPLFRQMIGEMAKELKAMSIDVVNCSRHSELTCFPKRPLAEALP
jgi:hypothetical protein